VRERGLVSLELQFGPDEFVSYTDYRKTELIRKSADWINRASRALWLSTMRNNQLSNAKRLARKTLAKYNCEDSKSKVLTFADSSSVCGHSGTCVLSAFDSYPLIGILSILLVLGSLALCVRRYNNKKKLTAPVTP